MPNRDSHNLAIHSQALSCGEIGWQADRLGGAEHPLSQLVDSAHFELPDALARDAKARRREERAGVRYAETRRSRIDRLISRAWLYDVAC